jgi:hypothetical protein
MCLSIRSGSNRTQMTLIALIFADFSKILSAAISDNLGYQRAIILSTSFDTIS